MYPALGIFLSGAFLPLILILYNMDFTKFQLQLNFIMYNFVHYCEERGVIKNCLIIPCAFITYPNPITHTKAEPKPYFKLRCEMEDGCSFEQEVDLENNELIASEPEMF